MCVSLHGGLTRTLCLFELASALDFQRAESFPFNDEKKDFQCCL